MTSFIKNAIYSAIGTASVTNDKIKELLEDLIQNHQFTEEEGKRIVDNFLFDFRQRIDTVHNSVVAKVDEVLIKSGFPTLYTIKDDFECYIKDIKEDPTLLLKLPAKK